MGYERITDSPEFDGPVRDSHEYRYQVAGRYTKDTDVVIDAACGTGYGKKFLKGKYVGVDRLPGHVEADLSDWKPDFDYDVFVTIETIEHLPNFIQHITNAKKAKRIIVASTPIIPTVGINEFHVHDFTMDDLKKLFIDEDWELIHEEIQNDIYGIIVLQRKNEICSLHTGI